LENGSNNTKLLNKMAKLIRLETDYRFYVAELTDEQLALYEKDEDAFWENDEMVEEIENKMEYVKDKDGGTEYYIEK
jgi:hypothetical protein